ncbi:MAG: sulfatase-like hydrolase/transferase, partial [Planctomycetes bacterium]|nr:sulfatase-like hydrolase/transferase [Planctomycetota bacterium]
MSLVTFFAAAIVTDGLLVLLVAFGVLVLRACVIRTKPSLGVSPRLWTLTRASVLGFGACYLYVAWMHLHILRAIPLAWVTSVLIFVLGMLGLCAIAWLLSARLWGVKKRWPTASPARIWVTTAAVLVAATIPGFMHHRSATRVQLGIQIAPSGPRPNVLLITLDTVRADYLACYGHPWIKTPNLDRIARDGVLFETAVSQAPTTCPSHGTIMTSLYPFDHDGE